MYYNNDDVLHDYTQGPDRDNENIRLSHVIWERERDQGGERDIVIFKVQIHFRRPKLKASARMGGGS